MSKRVLTYLEPCIFRDDPQFLRGHLPCFIDPMLRALSLESELDFLGFASNIFLSLAGLDSARAIPNSPREVKLYPLYNGDLLAPFGFCLEDYARDVFGADPSAPFEPKLLQLLTSVIEDARPDIVVTTSQNRYLEKLSQKLGFTVFNLEFGPLPRLMYQANRFISVDGHLSFGAFASPERLRGAIKSIDLSQHVPLIRDFLTRYLTAVSSHPQYESIRSQLKTLCGNATVSLLALQPEQWLTWEGALGKRRSATSIVLEALSELRTDKLIVTFHMDKRGVINPVSMREIWLSDPRIELLPEELSTGLSELYLPLVDELITVSSNLAMAAFLLGKPIRSIGNSFAQTLEQISTESSESEQDLLREKVLRYLTDYLSVSDATFSDPEQLRLQLERLVSRKVQATPTMARVPQERGEDLRCSDLAVIHRRISARLRDSRMSGSQLLPIFGRHALGYMLETDAVGAEFGVASGFFSESLLRSGRFSRLYSIDKWSDHHNDAEFAFVRDRLVAFGERSRIIRHSFDDALRLIPDRSLDFVYVDGYAHTGHDAGIVRQCLSKLKPGALVAVHDYDRFSWPINHRCLTELFDDEDFTDQRLIPGVLTTNNEDIFPGWVARYSGFYSPATNSLES